MLVLTEAVLVQVPVVDRAPRVAVGLGHHVHPRLPARLGPDGHPLDDAQPDVLVQLCLDPVPQVDRDRPSIVCRHRSRPRVDVDLEWFTRHHR